MSVVCDAKHNELFNSNTSVLLGQKLQRIYFTESTSNRLRNYYPHDIESYQNVFLLGVNRFKLKFILTSTIIIHRRLSFLRCKG